MNNVEFLIQKEGDQAWLPLESPTVEVLEGRYHLVALSGTGAAPAQIQIRHRYTQEGVLQEELEQKLLKPNDKGQLQILSSVYLGYGLWTISCTPIHQGDEMSPVTVTGTAINLQVLEEDFELISDWEFTESTHPFSEEYLQASHDHQPLQDIQDTPVAASMVVDAIVEAEPSQEQWAWEDSTCPPQPTLPTLPQTVKKVALQPSQGSSLPPQLEHSAAIATDQGPQLPNFDRAFKWRYIPLERLSAAWQSYPVRHRQESNHAFADLQLQHRFCQNLTHLATLNHVAPAVGHSGNTTAAAAGTCYVEE